MLPQKIILHLLQIPAGIYEIGDDSVPNASPQHHRRLESPVWLLACPVTWEFFEALVAAGGFRPTSVNDDPAWANSTIVSVDQLTRELLEISIEMACEVPWRSYDTRDLPVTGLNWYAAGALATFADARLPSEIEWEIAMKLVGTRDGITNLQSNVSSHLQEWTSDSFVPKYWRADPVKRGVSWKAGASHEVTIRGSSPHDLYKHTCYRQGCEPKQAHHRRGFRFAWDQCPKGSRIIN